MKKPVRAKFRKAPLSAQGEARRCLLAMAEAFKEPAGGSWWAIRHILERHNIFHEDIGNTRALLQLVKIALKARERGRK